MEDERPEREIWCRKVHLGLPEVPTWREMVISCKGHCLSDAQAGRVSTSSLRGRPYGLKTNAHQLNRKYWEVVSERNRCRGGDVFVTMC
jgi:hypothetical protein